MDRKRLQKGLVILFVFGLVMGTMAMFAACGGGSGSSSGNQPAATNPTLTTGTITGFGSVIVDGVEFETDATTRRRHLDDGPEHMAGDDSTVFSEGMVVTVQHEAESHVAEKIDFVNNLEGPIANATAAGCTIFGVPVNIGSSTVIHDSNGGVGTIADIVDGDIAEVSGIPDPTTGEIPATYIEVKPAGSKTEFEIKGYVSNLDTANQTFSISTVQGGTNTVSVDYATAKLDDSTSTAITDGMFAEVKTDLAGATASPVVATKVEAGLESEVENEVEHQQ